MLDTDQEILAWARERISDSMDDIGGEISGRRFVLSLVTLR